MENQPIDVFAASGIDWDNYFVLLMPNSVRLPREQHGSS
jgi:hypothetical protein